MSDRNNAASEFGFSSRWILPSQRACEKHAVGFDVHDLLRVMTQGVHETTSEGAKLLS